METDCQILVYFDFKLPKDVCFNKQKEFLEGKEEELGKILDDIISKFKVETQKLKAVGAVIIRGKESEIDSIKSLISEVEGISLAEENEFSAI